jgi:hypothetical protein
MGGDLNLKKSWHPNLLKNQRRVFDEEKKALDERRLIEKLRKEREEEAEIEKLQRLNEQAGGRVAQKRVDWLYAGPSGDGNGVTEEREGYLLGKRRIDHLLKANDASTQSLTKGAAVGIEAVGAGNANLTRDVASKVAQDPLLLIQKQKMEMQMKMIKDAQRKAKNEEKREKERKHKHRTSRRDRSRSRDSSDEREKRHRHRHRSRSPRRRDRDERVEKRRYSYSPDSTDDRERRHRHHRRSRSPRRRDDEDRADYRKRSRSPRRRENRDDRNDERRRSPSPYYRKEDKEGDTFRRRSRSPYRKNSRNTSVRNKASPQNKAAEKSEQPEAPTESVADKLAKMQADASSLEEQRNERVRLLEERDAAEEAKHKQNQDGGRRFITGLRGKTTEMDLGDVIARGRHGFAREVDV